jgi:hypothetical protein
MNLSEAFGRYGAKPGGKVRGLSAIAADGAMVLNCSHACFGHPSRGVLRYEDRLSREAAESRDTTLLGEHLALARDGALPVRMVVTSQPAPNARKPVRSFHVRDDLIGKIVKFDGDHFIVDFTRRPEPVESTKRRK